MLTETKTGKREESKVLTRRRPADLFSLWEQDMDKMFADLWNRRFLGPRTADFWRDGSSTVAPIPALDVYEEKDDVVVKAELPGMSKEDIDLALKGSTLTLRGEKNKEEELKEEDYFFSERSYGAFARNIDLPAEVKTDQVKATFKDGILQIRLPKTEEAKRKTTSIKIA